MIREGGLVKVVIFEKIFELRPDRSKRIRDKHSGREKSKCVGTEAETCMVCPEAMGW